MTINIANQKFSRLLVLNQSNRIDNQGYKRWWLVRCDCGKEIEVLKSSLISGNTKSCGCYRNELSRKRLKGKACLTKVIEQGKEWEITSRRVYRSYRDGDLSFEKFLELSQKPCYYCGRSPFRRTNSIINALDYRQETKDAAWWTWNGLDRIDSNKTHVLSNVVTCCYDCNFMKCDKTKDYFLKIVGLIVQQHLGEI